MCCTYFGTVTSTDHCVFVACSDPLGHARKLAAFAASHLGLVCAPSAGPGRPEWKRAS